MHESGRQAAKTHMQQWRQCYRQNIMQTVKPQVKIAECTIHHQKYKIWQNNMWNAESGYWLKRLNI